MFRTGNDRQTGQRQPSRLWCGAHALDAFGEHFAVDRAAPSLATASPGGPGGYIPSGTCGRAGPRAQMPRVQVLAEVRGRGEEVVLAEHVPSEMFANQLLRRPARRAHGLGARRRRGSSER